MRVYFINKSTIGRLKVLFILSLFGFACSQNSKSGSEIITTDSYYLEKVDSIRIDRENTVTVLDFNPIGNKFLAYDQITQEFLVLDERDQVLEAVYRIGEGPNEYNSNTLAASFNHERGGYSLLSSRDFLWFNENWEVEKRLRFAPHAQIRFYTGPRFKVPYYTSQGDPQPYLFTNFFTSINSGIIGEEGGLASKYLIELYNPHKDSLEWRLPNDPQLLPDFELDEEHGQKSSAPVYALDNEAKLMYLTFERSGEVGVYNMADAFALKEKIAFDQESFIQSNKSKNTALFTFGSGTIGVLYFMGLSEAATQARRNNNPGYFPFSDPSLYRLIMVRDRLQQEEELAFPADCEPHSEIVQLPGNRILLRDRYQGDDEPEYSTYSIFELKSE